MNNPNPQTEPNRPVPPQNPGQDQELSPAQPDTEINPAEPGNVTEVDLDKSKISTFPQSNPPSEH